MKLAIGLHVLTFMVLAIFQRHKIDAEKTILSNNFDDSNFFKSWGDWGEWERCPEGKYATAFQIRNKMYVWSRLYLQERNSDNTGVNGIVLFCNAIGERSRNQKVSSAVQDYGDWEDVKDCNDGLLNSFQLAYLGYQGRGLTGAKFISTDDAAVIDVWFFCIGNNQDTVKTGISGGGTTASQSKWTERKTCPKGEAICGLRTQISKNYDNGDNFGLNNVEFECCTIIGPASNCIPSDRSEMVTECDNIEGTSPLTCTRSIFRGTLESNTSANTTKEDSTSSQEYGFDLKLEFEVLKASFSSKLGHSDLTGHEWKTEQSSTFFEYVVSTFSFNVPPGTITQLYQIVGECGPYTIRTLQMTKLDIDENGNSGTGVPFIVEVDEEEKDHSTEEEVELKVLRNNFNNSDFYQNWGDWGEWDRCPKGKFATAFQIKNQFYKPKTDNTGVNAIALYCNAPGDRSRDNYVMSSTESKGEWNEIKDCNDGLLNSFQLAYLGYQGPNRDDAAVIDVWFYCVGDNPETVKTGMSGGGTTTSYSKWTERKTCLKREAICGIRTQISKFDPKDDNIGLNNVEFECCPIVGPAATCEPSDQMEKVAECDNVQGSTPFKCVRTVSHGTSVTNTSSNTTKQDTTLLRELGLNLKVERKLIKSVFSTKLGYSETTSHEWKSEDSSTFNEFVNNTVSFEVTPGVTAQLYQIVGQCGPYIVRTLRLTRFDYDGDGNEFGHVEVEVDSESDEV